jgi:hypothetical protein
LCIIRLSEMLFSAAAAEWSEIHFLLLDCTTLHIITVNCFNCEWRPKKAGVIVTCLLQDEGKRVRDHAEQQFMACSRAFLHSAAAAFFNLN